MVLNKVDVNQSGFMVILIMVMNNAAKPFVDKHVKHLAKQVIKNQGFVY